MKNYICSVCNNEMFCAGGAIGRIENKITFYKCEICGTKLMETINMSEIENSKIGKIIKKFTEDAIKDPLEVKIDE